MDRAEWYAVPVLRRLLLSLSTASWSVAGASCGGDGCWRGGCAVAVVVVVDDVDVLVLVLAGRLRALVLCITPASAPRCC